MTITTAEPITAIADLSCNVLQDTCPTQYNGKCEAGSSKSCNLDCGDCDLCTVYDYDCTSCLQQGCYYCPGDAKCYNSNRYQYTSKIASCTSPSTYLHDGDSCEHVDDTTQDRIFTDPAYLGQAWVYDMIHIQEVWKRGILGEGVRVRINDNGIDANHPEFAGRFDPDASCDNYQFRSSDDSASHGTSVAGIIGAAANNGVCSVGISPKVTLSACYVFEGPQYLLHGLHQHDISQNSYGVDGCIARTTARKQRQLEPLDDTCPFTVSTSSSYPCTFCTSQDFATGEAELPSATCQRAIRQHCQAYFKEDQAGCLDFLELILGGNNCLYDTLSPYERQAFTQGIIEGRSGKGIIYVFASGNAFARGDDTNLQAYTNTRYLISVGAVGKDRLHASYSTPGASLFLVAPGGDSENVSNHITTAVNGQCTNAGIGTSFACPVVSGVVALLLQVRPDLTWRDVQYILASTSQAVENDPLDTTAQRNAAGYWHSNWYGFGIVHAANAVELAESWTLVGPEQMLLAETGPLNLPIVDDESVFLETSVIVQVPTDTTTFRTESVVVQLDIESFARGHLEIILTSPQGTSSILHPGERPENTQLEDKWKLLTVRNWGEDPSGEWTLTIVDLKKGDAGECASDPWEVQVGEQFVDCNFLERVGLCVEGLGTDPSGSLSAPLYAAVFQTRDNGLLAQEACCACGGGLSREEVSDQLIQWTLVVYGQEEEVPATPRIVTTSPTAPPTPLPTRLPTTSPTTNPTPSPTQTPTSRPTTASPTSHPTMVPTSVPSPAPTEVPSTSPSNTMTTLAPATDLPSLSQSMAPSELPFTATVSPLVDGVITTDTSNAPSSTPTHSSFSPTHIAPSTTPSTSQSIHPTTSHHPSTDPTTLPTAAIFLAPIADNYPTHVPSTLASFALTTAKPSFVPSTTSTTTRANDDLTAMPTVVPQPTSPPTTMPSMDSTVSTSDPTMSSSTTTAAPSSVTTTTTTVPPSLTTLLPSTTTSPTTTPTTADTSTSLIDDDAGTAILTPSPTRSPSSMPVPLAPLSSQMPSTDATTTESTSTTNTQDDGEDRTTTILPPSIEENETPPPSSTSPFPTGTGAPSTAPSTSPFPTGSRAPSVVPTGVPSQEPTITATPEPSVSPSLIPTSVPPSMEPSVSPSLRPTTTPSLTTTTLEPRTLSPTTNPTATTTSSTLPPASIARSTNLDTRNTSSSGGGGLPNPLTTMIATSIVMTIMMMSG